MPREVASGIFGAIGNTPLVRLEHYFVPAGRIRLFAKLEGLNPGGSAKDRPAAAMLSGALQRGEIGADTVIVESSSGNMGIGIAQVCALYGLRFICVVDPKTTAQNLRMLEVYGAEIDLVSEPDPETGEFLQARLCRVRQLLREIPEAFWPNQYASRENAKAHYQTTMQEIVTAMAGEVDYLFCATSTCGTVTGCAEYVRDQGLSTKVVAVDAVGSLIFNDVKGPRLIPGLGAGLRPDLCRPDLIERIVFVTDSDCVVGCRRLVRREGLLAGGSSGGVLVAVERLQAKIPAGSNCVVILPDRGDRYLDTIYSDQWVRNHFGKAFLAEIEFCRFAQVAIGSGET